MPAVLVAGPTVTQNSPFLSQWRPKPPPVLIAPTHGGWPGWVAWINTGIPPKVDHQSQY